MTVYLGRRYAKSICSIFPLCMKPNVLRKSTNNSVTSRFFALAPSMIQRIVRISDVVDRFLLKPNWFFQRIFSTSSRIHLRSLAAMALRVMSLYFLEIPKLPILWKKKDAAFCPFFYCASFIHNIAKSKKYVVKFSCLPYFRRYFTLTNSFSVLILFSAVSSSSSLICLNFTFS